MGTSRLVLVVVAVLAVFLIPLAGTGETVGSGEDEGTQVVTKSGRADEMAAWSVDSGGGEASGGDFSVTATIGQPDAGLVSQGDTVLAGGLWAGAVDSQALFCNGFESGGTGSWSSVVGETK